VRYAVIYAKSAERDHHRGESGAVMATVKVRLGDQVVTSSITKDAAEDLGLAAGMPATVFIKSTEVTIGID
jgi:molybdate transport system regulatory protein